MKCKYCNKFDHCYLMCPLLHFTADYEKIILKHNFPFKRVTVLKRKKGPLKPKTKNE